MGGTYASKRNMGKTKREEQGIKEFDSSVMSPMLRATAGGAWLTLVENHVEIHPQVVLFHNYHAKDVPTRLGLRS